MRSLKSDAFRLKEHVRRESIPTKKPANPIKVGRLPEIALERSGSGVMVTLCLLLLELSFVRANRFRKRRGLLCNDLYGMEALGPLDDFKIDRLPGLQCLIAIHSDRRVVRKQVFRLAVFNDEAIPLGVVKPLDLTA